jgi:hypothetical protein
VLGGLSSDHRPKDHRPNLYVVTPGLQQRTGKGPEELSFNLVLNSLPASAQPVEWDVYWAIVLDPALRPPLDTVPVSDNQLLSGQQDITSERELILATQDGFVPGEQFEFHQIPGATMLRECLHIDSLAGLNQFRSSDGSLPRLLIVPSGRVIRAGAFLPQDGASFQPSALKNQP